MLPMAAGVLTRFSYSVLAEIASRAWYEYYDRIKFEPTPRTTVLRHYQGRVYTNLSVSAQLDSQQGHIEPVILQIDQQPRPLADWQKPGMLVGLGVGRIQKRINQTLDALTAELPEITARARQWYMKTQELKWSQAEILQIMEEIERFGVASMVAFFAARHNLGLTYYQLLRTASDSNDFPKSLSLVNDAFSDLDDLPESIMAQQILEMSQLGTDDPALTAWIEAGDFDNWQETLPHEQYRDGIQEFLSTYGHRAVDEGEISNPRFGEDITPLIHAIWACAKLELKRPINTTAAPKVEALLNGVQSGQRKQAQNLITKASQLLQLQSEALNAFAYILAGTRRWIQAATDEAMSDARLQQLDDGFFFELEELKEMMTGERNISQRDAIQADVAQNRAAHTEWLAASPPLLLIGDDGEADSAHGGYSAVSGQAFGPLRDWSLADPSRCHTAIVGTDGLTSGWALTLPIVECYITASGTPYDPLATVARAWHVPTVMGLGPRLAGLMEGAQTTVDGELGLVDQ